MRRRQSSSNRQPPGQRQLRVSEQIRHEIVDILREGTQYGRSGAGGGGRVNVEYVSANPTGPMHVGHGRGAVFGDALASLLPLAERRHYLGRLDESDCWALALSEAPAGWRTSPLRAATS